MPAHRILARGAEGNAPKPEMVASNGSPRWPLRSRAGGARGGGAGGGAAGGGGAGAGSGRVEWPAPLAYPFERGGGAGEILRGDLAEKLQGEVDALGRGEAGGGRGGGAGGPAGGGPG